MTEIKIDSKVPVWVLHVKQGFENRERAIRQQLEARNMHFEFVLTHDIPDLDPAFVNRYFSGDMAHIQAATSCAAKHMEAWRRQVESEAEVALILEDDIFLSTNFSQVYEQILVEARKEDLLVKPNLFSLENTGLKFVPSAARLPNRFLYPAVEMRCAGAYLITLAAAKVLLDMLNQSKMNLPVDWWLNQQIELGHIQAFWSHPTIAEQGSHNGAFPSGIDSKSWGVFRKISWGLQRIYKTYFRTSTR